MYNLYLCIVTDVLEFINYSLQSKANINDDHLDQVDKTDKHQIKHHQVFIRHETCVSSEIKHSHLNEMFC